MPRSPSRSLRRSLVVAVASAAIGIVAAGCSQEAAAAIYPKADLCPPALLQAGPADSRRVLVCFDEAVIPVQGSFASEPSSVLSCLAQGEELAVTFESGQAPGLEYALVGEVDDACGNRARFLLKFTGWNDRAPPLRISEVQTGKNSSKTKPHRDFIELQAMAQGNIGGEELAWASSVKEATYRFPPVEVRTGDYIVLHLAPEGLPEEIDERDGDLSASGGVDATSTGCDLWCATMALPDESGAVSVSLRPGQSPNDGLFYAADDKSGALPEDKLGAIVAELVLAGAWTAAGEKSAWEDALRWKASSSKSICRREGSTAAGHSSWYLCASSAQTPGSPNAAAAASVSSSRSAAPKLPKKANARRK